ncbi:MAG TPA: hypothetical protein VK587_11520 [bacterium]|nr:hypothetical protein [bacterium]
MDGAGRERPSSGDRGDVAAMVRIVRLRVPEGDLSALVAAIEAVWAGAERLRELPIEGREPAFRPPSGLSTGEDA